MKDINLFVNFVLDMSGSMGGCWDAAIEGTNDYIKDLRKAEGKTWLSLTLFDTEFIPVHVGTPIAEAEYLTRQTYCPRGATALYDAIANSIVETEKRLRYMPTKPDKVLTVILTDGIENASEEYSRRSGGQERIHALIKAKQEAGWDFVYLGANHDAFATSAAMGISRGYTGQFASTHGGVMAAGASTSRSTTDYRSAVALDNAAPAAFYSDDDAAVNVDPIDPQPAPVTSATVSKRGVDDL